MRLRPALCLSGWLACAATAQTTHVVGPGFLPEIRSALALASAGDVILVLPGTYAHFTAAVGVTIRAVTPGTVAVTWQPQYVPAPCLVDPSCLAAEGVTLFAPPLGQTIHVVGVDFLPNVYQGVVTVRHCVAVSNASVSFDQCSMQANGTIALWVFGSAIHLQDCAVAGTGTTAAAHGMLLVDSMATAADSMFAGNSGLANPGDAVVAINSTFHGASLQAFGGAATAGGTGAAALRSTATSTLWICDSMLTATNQCPLIANGAGGRIQRSTLMPTSGCASLAPGPMLGVDRPVPPLGGGSFTLRFRSDPNVLVAVLVGPELAVASAPGLIEQPLSLSLMNWFGGGVYMTDASGFLSVTWSMPGGSPFVNEPLWFQAVGGLTLPLQVSPIAGGIVR